MTKQCTWVLLAVLIACTSEANDDGADAGHSADALGMSTKVDPGYKRYYSSVQKVGPGESLNLMEWVGPALDEDVDIVDVKGGQTLGGHHVTLNASSSPEKVGTVRPYLNQDQLTSAVLGAAGELGEGTRAARLPAGYVFRAHKGDGFFLQTHYINVTDATLEVRSYIDVELAPPSKQHTVLSMFANATFKNRLEPAAQTTVTVECVTQRDLSLLMFVNHMHQYGRSVRTEAILPNGKILVIKDDPVWDEDWQLTPNYKRAFDQPVEVPKGSMLRTTCQWANTTDKAIAFPDEMCVFTSFRASETKLTCADGQWSERDESKPDTTDTGAATITRIGEGACGGDADLAALPAVRNACLARPQQDLANCGLPLLQGDTKCIVDCFEQGDVSTSCSQCYGDFVACNAAKCASMCSSDPQAAACSTCQKQACCPTFEGCSGVACL